MKKAKISDIAVEETKSVGRPRIFETDQDLLKAWNEYKEDLRVQAHEWKRVQYVGREGNRVEEPQKIPYTFEGFKRFCRENYGEVEQYFVNQEGLYGEYISISRAIKEEIRENQITGGLLGFYNAAITARLNGLADKTETRQTDVDGNDVATIVLPMGATLKLG